jgi:hypothetical protein
MIRTFSGLLPKLPSTLFKQNIQVTTIQIDCDIDDKDCNFCSKYIEKKYCINYREAQLNEILNTMRRLGNKCTMCTIRKINQKYINLIAKYLEYKAKTK